MAAGFWPPNFGPSLDQKLSPLLEVRLSHEEANTGDNAGACRRRPSSATTKREKGEGAFAAAVGKWLLAGEHMDRRRPRSYT